MTKRRRSIPEGPEPRQRDAGLRITKIGEELFRFSGQHEVRNRLHNLQADDVKFPPDDLFSRVRCCREVWTEVFIERFQSLPMALSIIAIV